MELILSEKTKPRPPHRGLANLEEEKRRKSLLLFCSVFSLVESCEAQSTDL